MDNCEESAPSNTKSSLENIFDDGVYNVLLTAHHLAWTSLDFNTVHAYDMHWPVTFVSLLLCFLTFQFFYFFIYFFNCGEISVPEF